MNEQTSLRIVHSKQWRVNLDEVLQNIRKDLVADGYHSRERSLAVTKIQEAIMWFGMDLMELGTENPYPNSYNPTNTIVDPTSQGLKL